jgi:hypothetical protein
MIDLAAAQAALLQTRTAALSKSVAEDKGGMQALEDVHG